MTEPQAPAVQTPTLVAWLASLSREELVRQIAEAIALAAAFLDIRRETPLGLAEYIVRGWEEQHGH